MVKARRRYRSGGFSNVQDGEMRMLASLQCFPLGPGSCELAWLIVRMMAGSAVRSMAVTDCPLYWVGKEASIRKGDRSNLHGHICVA